MRVLIDTHVFLWWVEGSKKLPAKATRIIADQENQCLVSLASVWELAIKSNLGKLKLAVPVQRYVVEHIAANAFNLLDIRLTHVGAVETLHRHHGDPFDRLLVAQALQDDLPIISADRIFTKYGVRRIWAQG